MARVPEASNLAKPGGSLDLVALQISCADWQKGWSWSEGKIWYEEQGGFKGGFGARGISPSQVVTWSFFCSREISRADQQYKTCKRTEASEGHEKHEEPKCPKCLKLLVKPGGISFSSWVINVPDIQDRWQSSDYSSWEISRADQWCSNVSTNDKCTTVKERQWRYFTGEIVNSIEKKKLYWSKP